MSQLSRSQENDEPPRSLDSGVSYPDYEKDLETFRRFILEHEINTTAAAAAAATTTSHHVHDDDEDEDDEMFIPTDGDLAIRKIGCYLPHLRRIRDRHFYEETGSTTFVVEVPLDELRDWNVDQGGLLADRAAKNALRYHDLFCTVVDSVLASLPAPRADTAGGPEHPLPAVRDAVDVLHQQRLALQALRETQRRNPNNQADGVHNPFGGVGNMEEEENNNPNRNQAGGGATEDFPAVLMRRYELRILPYGRRGTLPPFVHQYLGKPHDAAVATGVSIRSVRSRSMGHLVTVCGMIVRASDVKPCCVVATYACDACGAEVYQVIHNQREFMPQRFCPSQECRQHKKMDTLHLQTRGSKLVKFQQLTLQELPNQVPMGHVPRSMTVYCRGELTRLASPGDIVTMDGIFLPQRIAESGYRAMKAGLISTTFLEAQNIMVHKKSFDESLLDSLTQEERDRLDNEILEVAHGDDPVGRLAGSIAPEIFGHEDIKRALLMQLVGGCTRTLPDGMRIRGDVNICLMGDPGVAKSQLLKHVASIAPRGVYTTGKGSSGVGLTAAVTKDAATGEMTLEGGALVLADRGICCIDEFDKMDESDRTAIHEVMEQQTVSIAKAGIVATLNARAAVLAAANPLYGRYNRSKSLSENVNLPNSLLSRFDLLFLVLDIADFDRDMALAKHVTLVHQNEGLAQKDASSSESRDDTRGVNSRDGDRSEPLRPQVLREYISRARQHHPFVPPEVAPYIVEAYVSLRMQDRPGGRGRKESDQTAMTPRQLLSILRLSQALARLRFSDLVAREDVDEAIRLTHMSKASLTETNSNRDGTGGTRTGGEDPTSRIYNIIRDYAISTRSNEVELRLCEAMVLRKGFTSQQLEACLEDYEALDVIQIDSARTRVIFTSEI